MAVIGSKRKRYNSLFAYSSMRQHTQWMNKGDGRNSYSREQKKISDVELLVYCY
jgi:hypothetical protein